MTANLGARRFAGHAAIYTVGGLFPALTAALVTPLVTRTLGPWEYGTVAAHLPATQVLAQAATLGLAPVITRQALVAGGSQARAVRLVQYSLLIALGVGTLALVSAPLWAYTATGLRDIVVASLAVVAGSTLSVITCCQAFFRGVLQPWAFVLPLAGASLGGQACGLLVAWLTESGADGYFSGLASCYGLVAVVTLLRCQRHIGNQRVSANQGLFLSSLKLGATVLPHGLAIFLSTGAVIALVSHAAGAASAGRAQLLLFVGTSPLLLQSALANAWAPRMYARETGQRGQSLERVFPSIVLAVGTLAVTVALVAPVALGILAPPEIVGEYRPHVMGLIVASVVPAMLYDSRVHILIAEGKTAWIAVLSPLALALSLGVASLFSARFGPDALLAAPLLFYSLQLAAALALRTALKSEPWNARRTYVVAAACLTMIGLVGTLPSDTANVIRVASAALLFGALVGGWVLVGRGIRGSGT